MLSLEAFKKILEEQLKARVLIETDGRHYKATLISPLFEGQRLLERQQAVNAVINPYLQSGVLHAFSMKTYTETEWEAKKNG